MRIKWLRLALKDLEEVMVFIERENPSVAKKVISLVYEKVQLLAEHPHLGRGGRVSDTRELVVEGTPFLVPYRIINNEIQILRVLHGSRNWPEQM